jgi:hydrogenase nickel incorporation protein HypA/HybF
MHETVIAQQIVRAVRATMEQRGASAVKTIDIELGQLEGLNPQELQGAFDVQAEGTPVEGAVLQVEIVPAIAFCPSCNEERPFELPRSPAHEIPKVLCPECGAHLELRGGRGFVILSARMVLEDP